ncbi:Hypothetical predicted protein [Olea europaea subsp. europaea]|uniref:Uncharacterized protein n=1 Tax=Olea europaea subsp. europaea TaxID=158383 RepID=A0A8S0QFN2_OLEEU|nr:Hypothetical predicted protein [Olea europaea subsp. europaea]
MCYHGATKETGTCLMGNRNGDAMTRKAADELSNTEAEKLVSQLKPAKAVMDDEAIGSRSEVEGASGDVRRAVMVGDILPFKAASVSELMGVGCGRRGLGSGLVRVIGWV